MFVNTTMNLVEEKSEAFTRHFSDLAHNTITYLFLFKILFGEVFGGRTTSALHPVPGDGAVGQAFKQKSLVLLSAWLLTISTQAYALCEVNGTEYRTNSDSSKPYITLANLMARASEWDNVSDRVTTCDVSQFTSLSSAFAGNTAFNQDLSAWDTSGVTDMSAMFRGATSLTSVSLPDTSAVTNMSFMFYGTTSLTSVSLPDTSAVTTMRMMFGGATSLTSVSLPDTSAVTDMSYMLYGATSLTSVSLPDTSAVTNMSFMLYGTSLTSVSLPDTSAVINMSGMFRGATSLTSVSLPHTSAVTNMSGMFYDATSLTSVSLSNTSAVLNMSSMFRGATSLTSVSLPDTSAVTIMSSMFYDATSFVQDIRSWDISSVTNFSDMFVGATAMINAYSSSLNWNTTPTAAWFAPDPNAPTIASTSINTANTELTVTFSESVYDTTGGTGDLEVADFALSIAGGTATLGSATPTSITKTSQSVWVLGFSTSGTANGSETITVVPASSTSIYDAAANAAATSQSNNTVTLTEKVAPTIASTSINTANTELTVTFSESVYDTTGGTGDLEVADFALSIAGGTATLGSATPTSITKTSQSVWVLGFSTSGTANGSETITVVPASSTSIYDAAANAAATSQSNNTVTLTEKVAPTIASTSINTANTELTVTFSESVYDTTGGTGDLEVADFALSIAGGTATLGSATPTSITKTSQTVWVLGFSTSGTANGSETITVVPASSTSIYDAAANAAATSQSNNTVTLTEKVAPTIASTSINTANTELTVTFSESVYDTTGGTGDLEVADFALSIAGGTATLGSATPTSITKTSQSVWVLGFSTSGTANGSETITVVPASSTSIYDAAANAAATSQSNNTVTLTEKVAPTIASTSINTANTELTVTFSESVYDTTGGTGDLEVADFALSIAGGTATLGSATPTSITKTSQSVWVLGFSTSGTANGSETITVVPASSTSIYDAAANAAATSQSNNTVTLTEKVAPTIASTSINTANTELTVTFSESVYDTTGGTGDLEVADFALSIAGGTATLGSATPTSITKTSQSVWVLGFSTSGTANGSETITVVPASSTSIYDAAANAAATSQSNNTVTLTEKVAPTIASTSINTANTELTVTFSESVYDTTGGTGDLEVADFALSIAGGTATLGSATPTSITKTSQSVWVLGFSTSGTANGSETITVVPASSTSIYDAAANAAATSQSNNTVTLTEKVAPTIASTSINTANTELTVTFSESVYDTTGGTGDLEVADFALSIAGGTATLGSATPTSITKTSQTVWVLGFSTSGTANGSETITVVPASSTSIYDAAANAAATSQSNNTVTLTEKVAPTIASTSINTANTELTVTFSESVYDTTGGTGDLEVADFALSIAGGTATLGSATPTSITKTSQSVWVLGFSTSGTANGSETITVVPASSTSIYDAAANAAATSQSNNTVTLTEKVAPTIASTSINTANTELTVTFSESVYDTTGGTGDLEVADFALSIAGGTATLGSATPTSITKTSQTVWVLGFSTSGTANGSETITVVPASSTSIYDAAANAAATSQSNNTVTLTEKVAPTIASTSINTANTELTVTFSESVYDTTGGTGDLEVADFALSIAGGTATLGSATPTSITKTSQSVWVLGFSTSGTANGSETITVVPASSTSIYDAAANAAATSQSNNTASLNGSPASEFATHKTTIKNAITGEAKRALRSGLASDQRMMTNTRTRFIADQSGPDANQDVAFFVDGSAELKATHLGAKATAKGNFFNLQATGDGTWRKLAFGDFDVQTDDAKNVSGFLKGRMAFETNLNSTTMLGFFVGGQVGRSTLKGTFEGSQNSFGASVGGYLVQTLAKDVYADMFASLGANRNTLKLSNGTLDLDSFYSTTTSTIGGSVTGVYDMDGFEVWPALTFTYGKTNVGNVDFTGKAYSITDTTLSLDAGKVHLASLSFTPEIRMPFELQEGSDTSSMATIAPRYTCEQTSSNSSSRNCGSGAAIGLMTTSEDGLTNLNAQFQYDKVGSTTRRSLQLGFEHKF